MKQIKTDIISDLGYKILYTDINYPLILAEKNETGIDKINTDCEKFIQNIEKNYIKENLPEIIKKCNEEGCYDVCNLYIRGKILYKDNEKINLGIDVSINTGGPYSYDLFYSKIYNLNNGKNLMLEDLIVNSNEVLENAKRGFINITSNDFDWIFSNNFDINKAQYYLSKNGIVFCFDESEIPNVIHRLEYTVLKENIVFR